MAIYHIAPCQTSIEFAPYSFRLWGQMPSSFTLQVQHKSLMVGYYYIRGSYMDEFKNPVRSHTAGLFYKPVIPITKSLGISPILGVFNHRFPTKNGAWWAFGLNLNYIITPHFSIYYQHISNGWIAKLNPGLDNIGLKFTF